MLTKHIKAAEAKNKIVEKSQFLLSYNFILRMGITFLFASNYFCWYEDILRNISYRKKTIKIIHQCLQNNFPTMKIRRFFTIRCMMILKVQKYFSKVW